MLKQIFNDTLDIIFPRFCLTCHSKINLTISNRVNSQNGFALCASCINKIKLNRYDAILTRKDCKDAACYFDSFYSPYIYDGIVKECIHLLKYNRKEQLMDVFGELLKQISVDKKLYIYTDMIIPVPLHKGKMRQRGFNQAELLGRKLSGIINIPIRLNILWKLKETGSQSDLDKRDRLHNVKGAFKVISTTIIKNKSILLIDDVFTTGATANECARVLIEAGANKVNVFTLARAVL